MDFYEVVKIERTSCKQCLKLVYILPCKVNKDIVKYFDIIFGEPKYPLSSVSLIRIDTDDSYKIEGKINSEVLNLSIPKELEDTDLDKNQRKNDFDRCLGEWLEDTLNMRIDV